QVDVQYNHAMMLAVDEARADLTDDIVDVGVVVALSSFSRLEHGLEELRILRWRLEACCRGLLEHESLERKRVIHQVVRIVLVRCERVEQSVFCQTEFGTDSGLDLFEKIGVLEETQRILAGHVVNVGDVDGVTIGSCTDKLARVVISNQGAQQKLLVAKQLDEHAVCQRYDH
ncbi:MAG: hypothetical protein QG607_65, partial [Patescibacteria group bacterium]|nr:hypothetical protein [Patescibacteria group bacterium]